MEAKRVVLVEPGDVLLIGNIGNAGDGIDEETAEAIGKWAEKIDLRIAMFDGAIDIDVLKRTGDG